MHELIKANDIVNWRQCLQKFQKVDSCHMPEYHCAYITRLPNSETLAFSFTSQENSFFYPFVLSPIILTGADGTQEVTEYSDISSTYGFTGPLSTTEDPVFLSAAWAAFDEWATSNMVICEFTRFSVYSESHKVAHPQCQLVKNRPISVSLLPQSEHEYLSLLSSKTRNMIRRAIKENLQARKLDLREDLSSFRELYSETIARNNATSFFSYDENYYSQLLKLPNDQISLYGVYSDDRLVSSAISLNFGNYTFYHLGASLKEFAKFGAGNYLLYFLACDQIKSGRNFFNVGGGRTEAQDDALFKFKKSNGTDVTDFYIGKRVLDEAAYLDVKKQWQKLNSDLKISNNLQFYRQE